jgi:hypothetical protein
MLMEQEMEIAISNHFQPYSCTATAVGSQDALMYAIPFAVRRYVYRRNFEPKPRPDPGHTR